MGDATLSRFPFEDLISLEPRIVLGSVDPDLECFNVRRFGRKNDRLALVEICACAIDLRKALVVNVERGTPGTDDAEDYGWLKPS